jgi:hypothetical protein
MVYGSEAILPTDLEYGAPRIRAYNEQGNQTTREEALGLITLGVGHVNETFTNDLEVETGVVRSRHRQSPLYASMEGVAYSLAHTTIEGSKAAPKGTAQLSSLLGLKSVADHPRDTLQGGMLPGLDIQGCL